MMRISKYIIISTIISTIFLLLLVACGPASVAQPETRSQISTSPTESPTATVVAEAPTATPSLESPAVTAAPEETGTAAPAALSFDPALTWEGYTEMGDGDPSQCKALYLAADGQAVVGPCGTVEETKTLGPKEAEWREMLAHFAPFTVTLGEDLLVFEGQGEVAGPAWERAIATWARFTYAELITGRTSASARTVLSWWLGEIPDQPGACAHLVVLAYGYAYANVEPCAGGGGVEPAAQGWLTSEEWAQFDTWLYNRTELYQENNYFSGQGSQEMSEAEIAELQQWAEAAYAHLIGTGEGGSPEQSAPGGQATPSDAAQGLCPEAPRPALVVMPPSIEPIASVVDLEGQVHCELTLQAAPRSGLVSAGGSLFYDVLDEQAQETSIWQFTPEGTNQPLPFTTTSMAQAHPFTFLVSPDGRKVVWGISRAEGQGFRSYLWAADIDGSNQVTLLDGIESGQIGQPQYPQPARFSPDNQTLFYAMQPDWIPPLWNLVYGQYHSLFSLPLGGGEPTLLFDCQVEDILFCIGDVTAEGVLAYTDPKLGTIHLLGPDGEKLNILTAPASEYVGPALFSGSGELAFSSATLAEGQDYPLPQEGFISLVSDLQAEAPETLVSNPEITTLVHWINDAHLVVYTVQSPQEAGMAIVSQEGEVHPISVELSSLASFITILP